MYLISLPITSYTCLTLSCYAEFFCSRFWQKYTPEFRMGDHQEISVHDILHMVFFNIWLTSLSLLLLFNRCSLSDYLTTLEDFVQILNLFFSLLFSETQSVTVLLGMEFLRWCQELTIFNVYGATNFLFRQLDYPKYLFQNLVQSQEFQERVQVNNTDSRTQLILMLYRLWMNKNKVDRGEIWTQKVKIWTQKVKKHLVWLGNHYISTLPWIFQTLLTVYVFLKNHCGILYIVKRNL